MVVAVVVMVLLLLLWNATACFVRCAAARLAADNTQIALITGQSNALTRTQPTLPTHTPRIHEKPFRSEGDAKR